MKIGEGHIPEIIEASRRSDHLLGGEGPKRVEGI